MLVGLLLHPQLRPEKVLLHESYHGFTFLQLVVQIWNYTSSRCRDAKMQFHAHVMPSFPPGSCQ
jgi:hypothetical protein